MDRVEELNARIYDRFVPSGKPHVSFSPRPIGTKYTKQAILDEYPPPRVAIEPAQKVAFLPSSGMGPLPDFCVDTESTLKGGNLFYALQKDPRAAFMPSTSSDLYRFPSTACRGGTPQTHPMLFAHVVAGPTPLPNEPMPKQVFNNVRLRTQTRA
jgi:hypothetical protein